MIREDVKQFVEEHKRVIKAFKDPDVKKKYIYGVKRDISGIKSELNKELKDKQVTLMRQYRGHNRELEHDIRDLEETLRYINGASMHDSKYADYIDTVMEHIEHQVADECGSKQQEEK